MTDEAEQGSHARHRIVYIDALRVLAVFFVVFNHNSYGFKLFANRTGTALLIYLAISIFCKFAVPVFFCISGALLLGRAEVPFRATYRKVAKYLGIIVLFSGLYYGNTLSQTGADWDFHYFFRTMYSDRLWIPLWFCYAYVAFLISLPILRPLAQTLTQRHFRYIMSVAIFFSCIVPLISFVLFRGEGDINAFLVPG